MEYHYILFQNLSSQFDLKLLEEKKYSIANPNTTEVSKDCVRATFMFPRTGTEYS